MPTSQWSEVAGELSPTDKKNRAKEKKKKAKSGGDDWLGQLGDVGKKIASALGETPLAHQIISKLNEIPAPPIGAAAHEFGLDPGYKPSASDPSKAKDKGGGKDKGGKKTLTPAEMEKQIEEQAAQNAWNQMGVALTNEAKTEQAPITAAITGQNTGADVKTMENQALAAAGLSPNSSAAQWMNSNIQQGAAADQPLMSAMNAYGKAYGAGQQGFDQALTTSGQANALGTATAPAQSWLSGIAQHIQSNLNYSGGVSPEIAASLKNNPALLYYLQQSGTGGVSGAGLTNVGSIPVPGVKQNAPVLPPATTAAGGATNSGVSSDGNPAAP